MAVRHIGMFLWRVVVKFHQHLAHAALYPHRIFPSRAVRSRRFAIFRQNTELRAVNVERMQHHVALTGNHPAFVLTFRRGKHRFIHIKRLTINPVGIMEIECSRLLHVAMLHIPHLTVVHIAMLHAPVAHIVIIHMTHHLAMIHTRHSLSAVLLHQHLHAHHVEHWVHR